MEIKLDENKEDDFEKVFMKQNSELYINKKKIISIEGIINIDYIYRKEIFKLIFQILLNILLILLFKNYIKEITIYFYFLLVFILIIATDHYYYFKYKNLNKDIKDQYLYDGLINITYIILTIGFIFRKQIKYFNLTYFLFFIPNLLLSFYLFFLNSKKNDYLMKKKFNIIESIQFFLIYFKLIYHHLITWFYTLLISFLISIFYFGVGIILLIILILSIKPYIDGKLEKYKCKLISNRNFILFFKLFIFRIRLFFSNIFFYSMF